MPLISGSTSYGIFDHDHRSIDDHAKIDRSQTHQVRRHTRVPHGQQGGHGGEGNRGRHDQSRTQVPEQNDEHDNNEHHPEPNIFRDRVNGLLDQFRAIVERIDVNTFRQRCLNLGDLVLHILDDLPRVASHQHHDHARYRLAIAIPGHRTLPQHRSETNFTDV